MPTKKFGVFHRSPHNPPSPPSHHHLRGAKKTRSGLINRHMAASCASRSCDLPQKTAVCKPYFTFYIQQNSGSEPLGWRFGATGWPPSRSNHGQRSSASRKDNVRGHNSATDAPQGPRRAAASRLRSLAVSKSNEARCTSVRKPNAAALASVSSSTVRVLMG